MPGAKHRKPQASSASMKQEPGPPPRQNPPRAVQAAAVYTGETVEHFVREHPPLLEDHIVRPNNMVGKNTVFGEEKKHSVCPVLCPRSHSRAPGGMGCHAQ
jgi:hypothetical protein